MTTITAPPALQTVRGPFLWLSGGFDYGDAPVPFFATSLSVEDAVNFIRLPNELPISRDRPIEIDELFQRELNSERVSGGILKYLQNETEPRFFNSITVALLPMQRVSSHLELADQYSTTPRTSHPKIDGYDRKDVGQVSIYHRPDDDSNGYIAWEPDLTHPVVLDGQHRLAALKMALSDVGFPGRSDLASSRVSVLLLVLDERAGFKTQNPMTVLSACRSVFIDLNKYAKSVSRARQYLLDEGDVAAASLRAILAPGVEANPTEGITARTLRDGRVPLATVGWRSETAKFDGDSHFITTVLALHGVVESILGLREPDSDDYEALRVYVQKLTSRLLEPSAASATLDALNERLAFAEQNEIPFAIPRHVIQSLAEGFRNKYGDRITQPLVKLAPYKGLISRFESAGLWSSPLEPWFSLEPVSARRLVSDLERQDPSPVVRELALEAKQRHLAYQVVFQRALLMALHSLLAFEGETWEALGRDGAASEPGIIDEFVVRYEARLEPALSLGTGPESPFVGAGLRPEGIVDFRKTRIVAITGFMVLACLAPLDDDDALEGWIADLWERPARTAGGLQQQLFAHSVAWRKGLLDVLRARQEDDSEDAVRNFGLQQLKALRGA